MVGEPAFAEEEEEEEEEEAAEFGRDGPLLISPPCGRFSIKVDASE